MFCVKTDFGMIGRLFGVPREWLSRIGAFCSSWKTEGRIIKLTLPDFPSPSNPIVLSVDEEAIKELYTNQLEPSENPTEIESGLDIGSNQADQQDSHTFGSNGAKLKVLTRIYEDSTFAEVHLYYRELNISDDGRICSIGQEHGVQIV